MSVRQWSLTTLSRFGVPILAMIGPVVDAQTATQKLIPHELLGKWVVVKELNTRTISCWGEKDAKKVLGTSIEYSREALSWGSFIRRLTG